MTGVLIGDGWKFQLFVWFLFKYLIIQSGNRYEFNTALNVPPSMGFLSVLISASKLFYRKDTYKGPYASVGIGAGAAVFCGFPLPPIVCIPVRFGYQWDRSFFDLGVNAAWVIYPIPEARVGINF